MSISLVFTSCLKDTEVVATNLDQPSEFQKIANTEGEITILIPTRIGQTPSAINSFTAALSKEEVYDRLLTYRVFTFLEANQALDKLITDRPDFDLLTMEDVEQYAPRVVDQFKDFDPESSLRNCNTIQSVCQYGALNEIILCVFGPFIHIYHKATPNHPSCQIIEDPCYPTSGDVLPHIQSKAQCENFYGFIWYNGVCWACH